MYVPTLRASTYASCVCKVVLKRFGDLSDTVYKKTTKFSQIMQMKLQVLSSLTSKLVDEYMLSKQ